MVCPPVKQKPKTKTISRAVKPAHVPIRAKRTANKNLETRPMAVIDIGSNAARLIVGSLDAGGAFVEHLFTRAPLQLGLESYAAGNRLSAAALQRLILALQGFGKIAQAMEVSHCRAIATAAIRDCQNQSAVLDAARRRAGIAVQVLDGKEEAALTGVFVARQFPNKAVLNIDSGGGSTDCALINKGALVANATFAVGTARVRGGAAAEKQKLKRWLAAHCPPNAVVAGSGGGARKLELACGVLSPGNIEKFLRTAKTMTLHQRVAKFDLTPDRARNIVPAAGIALFVLRSAKARRMHTVKGGLGEAVLTEMLRAGKS